MIVSDTDQVPIIDGLILIDCWEPPRSAEKQYLNLFYVGLVSTLTKFDFKIVVNSSSNCKFDGEDFSQLNTLNRYCWAYDHDDPSYQVTNQEHRAVFNLMRQNDLSQRVSSIINFSLLNNSNSAYITNLDDFVYYNNKHLNNTCKNWLVVGQSWGMCTHFNSMSLTNLRTIEHLNFYTVDRGFCKIDGELVYEADYENDSLSYKKIHNFGYQLL